MPLPILIAILCLYFSLTGCYNSGDIHMRYYKTLLGLKHLDIYLFLLSCIIIIAVKCIQFPSLTYNAEMYAESASNFFIHAYKDSFLQNIGTTDAGYLPLLQRIIAEILVKVFHVVLLFPIVSQLIAISFIAVMASLLNLNTFKNFSSYSAIRFILGLAIGLISDYELNAFINFVYYGAIFLFLVIFINKEKINTLLLAFFILLASVILLSKGQLIVFVPMYVLLLFIHFRKKEYRSFMFYIIAILAGLLQLSVMMSNISPTSNNIFALFPYYVFKTFEYYVLTYRHVFLGDVAKAGSTFFSVVLLFTLFVLSLRRLWYSKNNQTLYIFLVGNCIAFCSLFITVFLLNNTVNPQLRNIIVPAEQNIFDLKQLANYRSFFISNMLIFLTGILVLIQIFPKKHERIIVLVLLCFTSGAFFQLKGDESIAAKDQSYSQWSYYYQLADNEQYCIPINSYPLLLNKNCDYLLLKKEPKFLTDEKQVKNIILTDLSPLTSDAANWDIQAVILINKPNQFIESGKLELYAFNSENKIIGKAKQLVPTHYDYIYFYLEKTVNGVHTLVWKNGKDEVVSVLPNMIIFGNDTKNNHKIIHY